MKYDQYTFSLNDVTYGWPESFIYLWNEGTADSPSLVMGTTHSTLDVANPHIKRLRSNLLRIAVCFNGNEEPYTLTANPLSVTLTSQHGQAQVLIDRGDCIRIRSHHVSVYLEPFMSKHEMAKDRNDGSWEVCFAPAWKILVQPVDGQMKANAEINFLETKTENVHFEFPVNVQGTAEAAIHLYESNILTPKRYSAFDDVLLEHERVMEQWMLTIPKLPERFEQERVLTAYCILSNITSVYENFKTPTMLCSKILFPLAMAWHQCYAAIALCDNTKIAWSLIKTIFYHQDMFGMLPDWLKDTQKTYMATKPPIQGYAIVYFMQHADLNVIEDSEFIWLYEHVEKLHNWWMSFRDTDRDGIPQYDSGDEAGWDDATVFSMGVPVESPDLSAYIILVEEALSLLADRIGLYYKAVEWKERSQALLEKMIAFFWNGERFIARMNVTHQPVDCLSAVSYQPLLLGKRLPESIIDKMAADLSVEGDYLTPYGFTSERMDSPLFNPTSWLAGSINSALNFQLCFGLWDAGKVDLAKEATTRFVDNAVKQFWPFSYDPFTGKRLNRPSSQQPLTAWMSALFLALAGRIMD